MLKASKKEEKRFANMQEKRKPPVPLGSNLIRAFITGGLICVVGQAIMEILKMLGIPPDGAAGPTAAILIVISALLTGFGVYDDIGRFGGMGAALPITGFANAIVSPAMEFKREGFVLGLGARMFTVAGPVLVYGLVTSTVVGFFYYLLKG